MYQAIQLDVAVEAGVGRHKVQQASKCTRIKKEANVESGDCDQKKLENNEQCRRPGAGEEVVKSEVVDHFCLNLLKIKLLGPSY